MDLIAVAAATLWTIYMTDKAARSAGDAAAYTEATIGIDHGIEELERNLETKIRQQTE
jgi:hypothetical protein|uniref:Uncharacterized protein n=1 Tax=Siphoviridae sp. ctHEr2 TaxID=2826229 RepID=A0A8S5NEK9_9CAUD|nr:MAG TPA: hypothetical protein [Siphoviridae sp. ctHEr2]